MLVTASFSRRTLRDGVYWVYCMGVQIFFKKGPQPLFRSGSQAEHGEMMISSITNFLNYCLIFILCIEVKYLAAGPGWIPLE